MRRQTLLPSLAVALVLAPARAALQEAEPASAGAAAASPSAADEETLELLGATLSDAGREAARELLREVVAGLEEPVPGEEAARLAFLLELDRSAVELGSLEDSRTLRAGALELQTRLLPADHPDLLAAKDDVAAALYRLGDLAGALALEEAVLEARTRLLAPDHRDLLAAQGNVALLRKGLGDLAGALELEEAVLAVRSSLFPPDDADLLAAKLNLAGTRRELGDLAGALELEEAVLEARTRLLPPDHAELLAAKQGLAITRKELGDLAGALELEEAVLEARTRLLPPDHPDLLAAQGNLAATKYGLGDVAGARELFETVLEARRRLHPPDHPYLLGAMQNLAGTRYELGDLAGAHQLFEAVHEAWTSLVPHDNPDLLAAKLNLAATRKDLGDLAGALELEEAVLAVRSSLFPSGHPELLTAQQNLAVTRGELGDHAGALELEEAVLAARARLFAPGHPELLTAQQNLAATRSELGDLAGALELLEAVLAARTRQLPADHPELLEARKNVALMRIELGDLAGGSELVASFLAGIRLRAAGLRSEAPRAAREGARAEIRRLFDALHLGTSSGAGQALDRELFAALEELRLASVASVETAHALDERPELEQEARRIATLRSEVNDHASAGPEDAQAAEGWRAELLRLAEERDRAERGLRRRLAEGGAFTGELDARAVGARLASGEAAVSFLRYPRQFAKDPATGAAPPSVASLLAFVVRPGGAAVRLELGPVAEVEGFVGAWRAALGRPLQVRGIAAAEAASDAAGFEALGQRLRERVLDPVLAAADGARTLHLVLDDVLFLVPLDALPLGDGVVGERVSLRNEATLARLLRPPRVVPADGGLLVAGGIDYDAEPDDGDALPLDASTPPLEAGMRSGAAGFAPLLGARAEAESVASLFAAAFEREPEVLVLEAATKAALHAAAPRIRYLHLATHGWFAGEAFQSQLDALAEQGSRAALQRAQEVLSGFAPETLCGLALAGANRGKDSLGRVPGILTAEELASLDLRNCELAVLSACETNVGIRRAGQGIQSLQTALHAAGARSAITSLWRVDDAATRRLFELFYGKLWKEGLEQHEALWQAKMALRAEGHPARDWAAWVQSGAPD